MAPLSPPRFWHWFSSRLGSQHALLLRRNLLTWLQLFPPALSFISRAVFSSWNLFVDRLMERPACLLCLPNPPILLCLWYPCLSSHADLWSESQSTAQGQQTWKASSSYWSESGFSSLREPLLACVSLSLCTPEGRDGLPVGEPVSETSGRGLARERKSDFSRETQNVATTGFSMKQNIDKQWEIVKTQANPWESVSSAGSPWHFWSWLMASKSPFIHSCPWDDLLAEGWRNAGHAGAWGVEPEPRLLFSLSVWPSEQFPLSEPWLFSSVEWVIILTRVVPASIIPTVIPGWWWESNMRMHTKCSENCKVL